jgi:hypothetical protein
MNLERYKQKVGVAQLTHIIDEIGDDGLLSLIVEKLSEGTKPSDVARDLHLPFQVLWNWLEADPKRQRMYNHGWEMYASDLHAETIEIADSATVEDVAVARLRVDTRFKAASNYDRKRFGAKDVPDTRGFAGGVVINIGQVEIPQLAKQKTAERVIDVAQMQIVVQEENV